MIPTTQVERDRLEGVDPSMRYAINHAKRIEKAKPIILCRTCGDRGPCRAWSGVQEIEGGRTCHVCRALERMAATLVRGR